MVIQAAKILRGLFVREKRGETLSRWTYQLPQTITGLLVALFCSLRLQRNGGIGRVDYFHGATAVRRKKPFAHGGAVTIGSFIIGDMTMLPNENDILMQHEYGHYLQSRSMGWGYLTRVGLPSLLDSGCHAIHPVEIDANRRARHFFGPDTWSARHNPLYSQANQPAKWHLVHCRWWDHACWLLPLLGPLAAGICNTFKYNKASR